MLAKRKMIAAAVPNMKTGMVITPVLVGIKNPTTTDPVRIFDTSAR